MSIYTRTISSAWKLEVTHARGASFNTVSIKPWTVSAFIGMPSSPTSLQYSPQKPLQHRHGLVVIGGQAQLRVLADRGSYQAKQAIRGVFARIARAADNHTR